MAVYNLYSAHKYKGSYLPAILGVLMSISFLLIFISRELTTIAFFLAMLFALVNFKKIRRVNENKMKRYISDSKSNEPLKLADYFTGWKLLHRLNKKYGPCKASLINSSFIWIFSILIAFIYTYLWPDFFTNIWYLISIMTIVVALSYRQNKRLLESMNKDHF
jgi:membrane protein implicated in regulation of membrane protease activity